MKHLSAFVLAGAVVAAAAAACTSRDTLLDGLPPGAGGSGAASGAGGAGGSSGSSGGSAPTGGTQASGGSSGRGGAATGGTGGATGGGAGASTGGNGGAGGSGQAGSGGANVGGSGGGSGEAGSTGGTGGAEQCPPGQMWCPGCTPGTGSCGVACTGAACSECSFASTFEECEARPECHSVFVDPGTCGCATVGCCADFSHCADGAQADCLGAQVMCDAMTPFCDNPAYVLSYSGFCYEGCVDPKDCAPECTPPDDPSGCACYSDADCALDENCYGADCENQRLGTCRAAPPDGCFGDVDCPAGQTCIGGHPAPCGTTIADALGTCGVEECSAGDCLGSSGATCTCSDGMDCVAATGQTGSGWCRGDDGTCFACKCAAPDTPIATPAGDRPIADLLPGDLVYSVDGDSIRAVPIARINRVAVAHHEVLRVTFDHGRSIDMTAGHPLADGRPLSALRPGDALLGGAVVSVSTIPYVHEATYDILPQSSSGAYFASGVLIGSTLTGAGRRAPGLPRSVAAP
jgi:hypothetical protein